MNQVYIKHGVVKNIAGGHPWCFSGAIERVEGEIENGAVCELYSGRQFLGTGYFNGNSDIRVRLLSRNRCSIDRAFFEERIGMLKNRKEALLPPDTNCYRLVFGESDNLPGLVVDKYDDVLVVQIHTLGMDRLKGYITDALAACCNPRSIYERSDLGVRSKEGLPVDTKGLLFGEEVRTVRVSENGYIFDVDVVGGQKTGFYLDQRENRRMLQQFCRGKSLLNCFSYTGGFSVYAAAAGARVTSVDVSRHAIEAAENNFRLNGINPEDHSFEAADVFEYLESIDSGQFDFIILDPPSFAKSRGQLKNAIRAYTTINTMALKKLPETGILVSSSCTTHIDELTFMKILHQSAVNAGCQLKVISSLVQPFDHPYNLSFPEGRYLKFVILQKLPIL